MGDSFEPLNLILIDDDEVDRMAVRRAFDKLAIPLNIIEVSDGTEALAVLRGDDGSEPPSQPFLILLDINMPRMDGIEFLRHLRGDMPNPKVRDAIVFVLSTSEADNDRERAYAYNVAGYLVKSGDRGGLKGIAEMLQTYQKMVAFP